MQGIFVSEASIQLWFAVGCEMKWDGMFPGGWGMYV